MQACYFDAYARDFPPNDIPQCGVQLAGAELVACHEEVWRTRDKSQVRCLSGLVGTDLHFGNSRMMTLAPVTTVRHRRRRGLHHNPRSAGRCGHLLTLADTLFPCLSILHLFSTKRGAQVVEHP